MLPFVIYRARINFPLRLGRKILLLLQLSEMATPKNHLQAYRWSQDPIFSACLFYIVFRTLSYFDIFPGIAIFNQIQLIIDNNLHHICKAFHFLSVSILLGIFSFTLNIPYGAKSRINKITESRVSSH